MSSSFPHLVHLGWNSFFEEAYVSFHQEGWIPARVISEEKGHYRLKLDLERTLWGKTEGKMRHEAQGRRDLPATGDWVACSLPPGGSNAVVHAVLPRQTCLYRKASGTRDEEQVLAANVDFVFIATSLNGDLNVRRIERYLAMVWEGGSIPVLVLTKADLVDDVDARLALLSEVTTGVETHVVSVRTGAGIDALLKLVRAGTTSVLVGSSGVGKSTLVNYLLGETVLKTQEVRESDDRGRHTTTSRYLFHLPSGGMLIDTPGIRELQLIGDEAELLATFPDIESFKAECRFGDCGHQSEPGCGIKAAIAKGTLSQERLESFQKLERELSFMENKNDKGFQARARKKWRNIHTEMRKHVKKKRGD